MHFGLYECKEHQLNLFWDFEDLPCSKQDISDSQALRCLNKSTCTICVL